MLRSLTLLKDEKLNAKWRNVLRNCTLFKQTDLQILVFLVRQNSPKARFSLNLMHIDILLIRYYIKLTESFIDISWSGEEKNPKRHLASETRGNNKYWWVPGNCIFQAVAFLLRYKICLQYLCVCSTSLLASADIGDFGLRWKCLCGVYSAQLGLDCVATTGTSD